MGCSAHNNGILSILVNINHRIDYYIVFDILFCGIARIKNKNSGVTKPPPQPRVPMYQDSQ